MSGKFYWKLQTYILEHVINIIFIADDTDDTENGWVIENIVIILQKFS